jgi:hypothetical protein
MATAYTSLLGLALPVTGELSGAWGDVVNDSITSLLDSAISGTTSLTTDADVTLTTTTGAANQARQAIILWNPASGTTTRNITAPAQSKIYTVINASGGTQSIVFRGVGPTTGVTIVKGESAVVAWNGTDFIKVSNTSGAGTFTNLTVTGNTILGDASGDTITVNGTTTFANVNPTLTAGTANGVAFLNGSKVLTTGSSFTFNGTALTILPATEGVNFVASSPTTGSQINIGVGVVTGARPFIGTNTNSNPLEFGSRADTDIIFLRNTAEQMRLTSTGLGIGTSSPGERLEVAGNARVRDALVMQRSLSSAYLSVLNYGNTLGGTKTDNLSFGLVGGGDLLFWTNGLERARITSIGNFLVGTTGNGSPGLGVANSNNISFPEGEGASLATMFRQSSSGDLVLGSGVRYSSTANAYASSSGDAWARTAINVGYGAIKFSTAAEATVSVGTNTTLTERVRINSTGDLLVGTTTSNARLTVIGSASAGVWTTAFGNGTAYQAIAGFGNAAYGNGTWNWQSATIPGSGTAQFFTRFASVTSGGTAVHNVAIDGILNVGTTSTYLNTVTSNGGYSSTNAAQFNITSVNSSTQFEWVMRTGTEMQFYVSNAAVMAKLTASGVWTDASDARYKENIRPVSYGLAELMQLQPRAYNVIGSEREEIGFIAQEVEPLIPELVESTKNSVTEEDRLTLSYGQLSAVLVKAIQEQQALIQTLTARVAALESN